jgi:hypothetical protein
LLLATLILLSFILCNITVDEILGPKLLAYDRRQCARGERTADDQSRCC